MLFEDAINILEKEIQKRNPKTISASWVNRYAPKSYRFIYKHSRTPCGHIDWDKVTRSLPYELQRKWSPIRKRKSSRYTESDELQITLSAYQDRMYVFVFADTREERAVLNDVSTKLVRLAQGGNSSAQEYAISLFIPLVHDWIDQYKSLAAWRGYSDLIEKEIKGCITRFRYSGSFTAYLFRTLQYAGLGLRPLEAFSLDEAFEDSHKTRAENVIKVEETGKIELYSGI